MLLIDNAIRTSLRISLSRKFVLILHSQDFSLIFKYF